jgi:ABC-type ATPase involved in cell division
MTRAAMYTGIHLVGPTRTGPDRPYGPVMIELSEVTRHYDDGPVALQEVSLTVAAGEAVSILGPSGRGKSTTGALDTAAGAEVRRLLCDLHIEGQTIVLVTHDLTLAAECTTRTVRLVDGRVAA